MLQSIIDTSLQVTEALMYLSDQDLVHSSVSSHAVQMITPGLAKLAMLERTVLEGRVIVRELFGIERLTVPFRRLVQKTKVGMCL